MTGKDRAEFRRRMDTARKEREAEEKRRRARAEKQAVKIWRESRHGEHAYSARKLIITSPHNARVTDRGQLAIPVKDISGKLLGLQFIDADGGKKFLPGTPVTGHFSWIAGDFRTTPILIICEGFATGCSIHQATNLPVAAAFNCDNLPAVAKKFRAKYPHITILLAADNDQWKTDNSGVKRATEAAGTVNGLLVIPEFTDTASRPTDFNDLHVLESLERVRAQIMPILDAAPPPVVDETGTADEPPMDSGVKSGTVKRDGRFLIGDRGLFELMNSEDGEEPKKVFICTQLEIPALASTSHHDKWSVCVKYRDPRGVEHVRLVPFAAFRQAGEDAMKLLSEYGVIFGAGRSAKNSFLSYAQYRMAKCQASSAFWWIATQCGWFTTPTGQHVYVTPTRVIGTTSEMIIYDGDDEHAGRFGEAENLDGWKNSVAGMAAGNSRAAFALSAAFAAPMLRFFDGESTIFLLNAPSGLGKTTILRGAASVYGNPRLYITSHNSTQNATLANAQLHNDGLMCCDEAGATHPDILCDIAYTYCNDLPRERATIGGGVRHSKRHRGIMLSTGERDLAALVEGDRRSSKTIHAGIETRMISVPCDTGPSGVFEDTRDCGAKDYAEAYGRAATTYYGTAGPEFIRQLAAADHDQLRRESRQRVAEFVNIVCPKDAHSQVMRVATRFALVAFAGDLATCWGITGWPENEAFRAARKCFAAWLDHRGGAGQQEITALLAQVRLFFEQHGDARFKIVRATEKLEDTKVIDMYGYRRDVVKHCVSSDVLTTEYFVLPESFRRIAAGFEYKWAAKILVDKGLLRPGKDGNASSNHSFGGMSGKRYYHFVFDEDKYF